MPALGCTPGLEGRLWQEWREGLWGVGERERERERELELELELPLVVVDTRVWFRFQTTQKTTRHCQPPPPPTPPMQPLLRHPHQLVAAAAGAGLGLGLGLLGLAEEVSDKSPLTRAWLPAAAPRHAQLPPHPLRPLRTSPRCYPRPMTSCSPPAPSNIPC